MLFLCIGIAPAKMGQAQAIALDLPGTGRIELSLADLAAMPQTEYVTSTVWTDGVDRYGGVLLRDLLRHHAIDPEQQPGTVILRAIDGYEARLDFDLISDRAPMLAYLRNGATMPLRNQGPVWMIFPYDDDPNFRTESIYALSIWQVQSVSVLYK